MARETINGISVPIPGTGEPADFVGDLRRIATDLSASKVETALSWANADAYIDFATKPDGDPPALLDTGQVVDFTLQNVSGRKPQIAGGQLVHGTLPASGAFANYYQATCDGDVRALGSRWVVNAADGSTEGVATLAAWASVYEAAGTVVPQTPAHITFSTTTGEWKWWVSDGGGTGANNLKVVKQGTFTPPASDGTEIWEAAFYIDPDNGVGYLWLPGNDATTGTRLVTVTNAEISTALTAVSLPVKTFAELLAGADVAVLEPFANTAANTAIYPRFLTMAGEVRRLGRDRLRALRTTATTPPPITYKKYAPTTALNAATTTSSANVDATNARIDNAYYGPTGKILIEVCSYYEFTGTDTVFQRLVLGAQTTALEVAATGVNGEKKKVVTKFERTGGTPGASTSVVLQHSAVTGGLATLKAGGSGGATLPALYITATPL